MIIGVDISNIFLQLLLLPIIITSLLILMFKFVLLLLATLLATRMFHIFDCHICCILLSLLPQDPLYHYLITYITGHGRGNIHSLL